MVYRLDPFQRIIRLPFLKPDPGGTTTGGGVGGDGAGVFWNKPTTIRYADVSYPNDVHWCPGTNIVAIGSDAAISGSSGNRFSNYSRNTIHLYVYDAGNGQYSYLDKVNSYDSVASQYPSDSTKATFRLRWSPNGQWLAVAGMRQFNDFYGTLPCHVSVYERSGNTLTKRYQWDYTSPSGTTVGATDIRWPNSGEFYVAIPTNNGSNTLRRFVKTTSNWDTPGTIANTGQSQNQYSTWETPVFDLSPGGNIVFSAGGGVKVLTSTGSVLGTLGGAAHPLYQLYWSPDNSCIIIPGPETKVYSTSGSLVNTLTANNPAVLSSTYVTSDSAGKNFYFATERVYVSDPSQTNSYIMSSFERGSWWTKNGTAFTKATGFSLNAYTPGEGDRCTAKEDGSAVVFINSPTSTTAWSNMIKAVKL